MRRLIAILMLLLLPVYFTWVAASPYCEHEAGQAALHFGHHFHTHEAAHGHSMDDGNGPASAADDAGHAQNDSAKKAASDPDCTVCHLGAVPLPLADALSFKPLPPSDMVPGGTHHFTSVALPAPDRPNWLRLALSR